jgi:hypothetical protein
MLPTTGFFGGCGIGFSLLGDAIFELSPAALIRRYRHCEERSDKAIHTSFAAPWIASLRSQ